MFGISRPGVLEVRAQYQKHRPQHMPPAAPGKPLEVDPTNISGRVLCQGVPVPFLQVAAAGHGGRTLADGTFNFTGPFPTAPTTLFFAYEANIPLSATVSAHLQIMDDFHVTRSDSINATPSVTPAVAAYGDVTFPGTDCRLWLAGRRALTH